MVNKRRKCNTATAYLIFVDVVFIIIFTNYFQALEEKKLKNSGHTLDRLLGHMCEINACWTSGVANI